MDHGNGGGLNILNLFTEQLISHVHTLLKFGGMLDDMMGSLIQASWEGFILEVGLDVNIFEFPKCVTAYMTQTWLTHTWKCCCEGNIQIVGGTKVLTQSHLSDMELMCLFIWVGCRKTDQAIINKCRMYMKAFYLSDICNTTATAWNNIYGHSPNL